MLLRRPIRGLRLSLTPFGMCRSTRPASNSRSFCTCKTTSHLRIPHLLKVPQFQRFAQKSHLTPLVCADARTPGGRAETVQHPLGTRRSSLRVAIPQRRACRNRLGVTLLGRSSFLFTPIQNTRLKV